MKTKLLLWAIVCAGIVAVAADQKVGPRPPTRIEADRAEFDLNVRRAIYLGHVKVDDPEMKLQCEQLTVDLPMTGGQPTNIVAEVNVIIDFTDSQGQTARATGDRAVYHYAVMGSVTNATVTLTGSPKVDSPKGTLTGREIICDIATRKVSASDPRMIFRQNLNGNSADTNAPVFKPF